MFNIQANDAQINKMFATFANKIKNRQKLYQQIAQYLVNSSKMRFMSQTDPDGNTWKPSHRAIEQSGQTLRDTGRLMSSISYLVSGDNIEVGTNVKYAKTHQFGATIVPKKAKYLRFLSSKNNKGKGKNNANPMYAYVKKVVIPKRSFLGISKDDSDTISQLIIKSIS